MVQAFGAAAADPRALHPGGPWKLPRLSEEFTLPDINWKPKKGPIKTTLLLKGDYRGFHVSLEECQSLGAWAVRFRGLGVGVCGLGLRVWGLRLRA